MSRKQKGREDRRYNPADPNDWKIVQSLLEEVEDDIDGDFDPYSDEEEDIIETRNESTDTEQEVDSDDSSENDSDKNNSYFLGRDKSTNWCKSNPPRNVRTRRQNIVTHLPGVIGSAKSPKECWECFLTTVFYRV